MALRFKDIGDFLTDNIIGWLDDWLTPDPLPYTGGLEFKPSVPAAEPVVYGQVTNVEGVIVRSIIQNGDGGDDIPNDLLFLQVVWSVGKIEEIGQIYLGDVPIDDVKFDEKDGDGRWVYHWNYTEGENATLTGDGYSMDFESKGYSYSIIRLEYDPEQMNRVPKITADLKGIKVTPVGGGDKVYSNNFADILNDYMTNDIYGRGLPDSRMNQAALLSEKTFSGASVYPYQGSPSHQPLMSCNIRLDGNQSLLNNINKILQGCRGFLPYIDGQFHFIIERERDVLDTFEILDSNRMSDLTLTDVDIKSYYNRVTIRFKDREQKGKLANAVYPVDNAEYLSYFQSDNNVRYEKTITIDSINNMYEALQMAEIVLKRSRNALSATCSVKSEGLVVGVGQVINVSNDAFGAVQKPYMVSSKKTKATGIVELELLEYQPSIYPWNYKDEQIIADTSVGDYTNATPPTNLNVTFTNDDLNQAMVTWESDHKSFIVIVYDYIDSEWSEALTTSTANKFLPLNSLSVGSKRVSVIAMNGLGYKSSPANLDFAITVPAVPVAIVEVDSTAITVTFTPVSGGLLLTSYELKLNTIDDFNGASNKGIGGSFTLLGLSPDTDYYIWVRSVNFAGESAWVALVATTTVSTTDVANITIDQLDDNLANIINTADRDIVQLTANMNEAKIREIAQIGKEAEILFDLNGKDVEIGSANSSIVNLTYVTGNQTTSINQINHSTNGIYAQATQYTRVGIGYWDGGTFIEGAFSEEIFENSVTLGDGGTAKVSQISSVFQDIGGDLVARGGLITDNNGVISGFATSNDGTAGQFDILANVFRVGVWDASLNDGDGGLDPFLYVDSNRLKFIGDVEARSLKAITDNGLIQVSTAIGEDGLACTTNTIVDGVDVQKGGVTLWSKGQIEIYNNGSVPLVINDDYGDAGSTAILIEEGAGKIEAYGGGIYTNDGDHFSTSGNFTTLTGNVNAVNGNFTNFTAAHPYLFSKVSNVNPLGYLISEGEIESHTNINGALGYSHLSTKPRDISAVGVISMTEKLATSPESHKLYGLTLEREANLKDDYYISFVNAVGEGLMRVCSEAGDIKQGQWLCSSSTLGHAMLQTDEDTGKYEKYFTDYTVAKSRQSVIWDNEPENTKLIAVYYKGG